MNKLYKSKADLLSALKRGSVVDDKRIKFAGCGFSHQMSISKGGLT
jgi:hypothetical protein